MTGDERRFLAPLEKSPRTGRYRTWPWWIAFPLAALLGGLGALLDQQYDQPLRPDLGYVVTRSAPEACEVGIADDSAAMKAEVTVTGEDTRGRCTYYEIGERVWYDAGAPGLRPGTDSGADNGAVGAWALALLSAAATGAGLHDIVKRRWRLLGPTSPATPQNPGRRAIQGGAVPGSAPPESVTAPRYGRISTTEDLIRSQADNRGEIKARPLRDVAAAAQLIDLVRAGHATVSGSGSRARVTLPTTDPPSDPLLAGALARLRRHRHHGAQPRSRGDRLALAWMDRRNARPLPLPEALRRLGAHNSDALRSVAALVIHDDRADGAQLIDDLRDTIAGFRSPDQRTGPLLALLDTGRLTVPSPNSAPMIGGRPAWADDGRVTPDLLDLLDLQIRRG